MQLYRVNASVGELRHGEHVEIDDQHEHWARLIARGYLTKIADEVDAEPEQDRPARLAVPDIVTAPLTTSASSSYTPADDVQSTPTSSSDETPDAIERVRAAIADDGLATNVDIANRTGTTRRLVGKVRRGEV